jgi:hypothetical protein
MMIYSRDWFAPTPAQVECSRRKSRRWFVWKDGQADIRRYQMIRQRVGDRLHWVGGAGDDMVPAYYAIGVRASRRAFRTSRRSLSLKLHELASQSPTSAELTQIMKRDRDAALRAARQAQGIRGVGDEGADG